MSWEAASRWELTFASPEGVEEARRALAEKHGWEFDEDGRDWILNVGEDGEEHWEPLFMEGSTWGRYYVDADAYGTLAKYAEGSVTIRPLSESDGDHMIVLKGGKATTMPGWTIYDNGTIGKARNLLSALQKDDESMSLDEQIEALKEALSDLVRAVEG